MLSCGQLVKRQPHANVLRLSSTSVRYITIQQPATTTTTAPVSLGVAAGADDADTVLPVVDSVNIGNIDSIKQPVFKTIGTPGSLLSVTLPPSVPLHVKKGAVMSVYSFAKSASNFVKSEWGLLQPLRRLWLAGEVSSYQSVLGTVPLQILVSAYDTHDSGKASASRSFVNLTLDGSFDWVLFQPNSVQCYSGNSLNVRVRGLPKELQYGLKGRGFTWLNGRGLASVVGRGSVFKVGLGAGDEIRVERHHLFGISTKELGELGDGSVRSETWNSVDGLFHERTDRSPEDEKEVAVKLTNNVYVDQLFTKGTKYFKAGLQLLRRGKSHLTDYAFGNGSYVVIKGPRTVLIETGSGDDRFVVNPMDILQTRNTGVEELEKAVKGEAEWSKPAAKTGDNLGVVKIVDGKATYKNLENFDDEVNRIASLKSGR